MKIDFELLNAVCVLHQYLYAISVSRQVVVADGW